MAFTIRITFSGLCLFVADGEPGATTGRMHVLLPGMFGHHDCGHDRHVAALGYDAGSLVPGGRVLGVPALARLTDLALSFGSGNTASLRLCSQIPDLREITNRSVDPDHLGGDTSEKLVSRVTLNAGRISRVAQGVCWEWRPGEYRPIANRVEWEIPGVEGDSLTVVAAHLRGGGPTRELGTLYPTDGVLSLDVFHETAENMPPDPLPADHRDEERRVHDRHDIRMDTDSSLPVIRNLQANAPDTVRVKSGYGRLPSARGRRTNRRGSRRALPRRP